MKLPLLHQRCRGFTLLEVLISIGILAIVLGATVRASGIAIDSAKTSKSHVMALWVAQNRIAELQAFLKWPAIGERNGEEAQNGVNFYWRETITPTANDKFRRVLVEVFTSPDKTHYSARLVGYAHKVNLNEKTKK